jgi:hypothetical protein
MRRRYFVVLVLVLVAVMGERLLSMGRLAESESSLLVPAR